MQIAMPSETSAQHPPALNTSDATDTELATLACANKHAFAELYRRHLDRVYRYLLVRVSNSHDAEDLAAQTFMQAMQRINQFRGQAEFATWLLSIARNKANDYFRGRREVASLEDMPNLATAQPALDDVVAERLQLLQVAVALRAIAPDRLIYAPVYGGGIRDGNQLKAFIPGGASAPWFYEEHLDIPLEAGAVGRPARCWAREPSS